MPARKPPVTAVPTGRYRSQATSKTDLSLDALSLVLTQLKNTSALPSIPGLREAVGAAVEIITIVQAIKHHKGAFTRLAKDAAELVLTVRLSVEQDGVNTEQYLVHLQGLVGKLTEIESFARHETGRGLVMRIIKYKSDLDTITEYRENLRQSLDVFELQTSISTHEKVSRVEAMMKKLEAREKSEPATVGTRQAGATSNPSDYTRKELLREKARRQKVRSEAERQESQQRPSAPSPPMGFSNAPNMWFPGNFSNKLGGVQVLNSGVGGNVTNNIMSDVGNDRSINFIQV